MFYFQTLYYFFTLTQLRCFLTLILIRSTRKKYLKRIFDNRWKKKVKENNKNFEAKSCSHLYILFILSLMLYILYIFLFINKRY